MKAEPEKKRRGGSPAEGAGTTQGHSASMRDAWPWILIMLVAAACILAQEFGLFGEGVTKYLYIVACCGAGLLGLIGLLGWMGGRLEAVKRSARYAALAASPGLLASEFGSKRPDYAGHWSKVSRLSVRLGEELGLTGEGLETVRAAGLVMDIGMLEVLDEIGTAPADEKVTGVIRGHPGRSEEILEGMDPGWRIIPAVRHHHERFDGSGYPDGVSGEDIPLEARILAVSDALTAMTSGRPYSEKMTTGEALSALEDASGSWFDPKVVETAVRLAASDEGFTAVLAGEPGGSS